MICPQCWSIPNWPHFVLTSQVYLNRTASPPRSPGKQHINFHSFSLNVNAGKNTRHFDTTTQNLHKIFSLNTMAQAFVMHSGRVRRVMFWVWECLRWFHFWHCFNQFHFTDAITHSHDEIRNNFKFSQVKVKAVVRAVSVSHLRKCQAMSFWQSELYSVIRRVLASRVRGAKTYTYTCFSGTLANHRSGFAFRSRFRARLHEAKTLPYDMLQHTLTCMVEAQSYLLTCLGWLCCSQNKVQHPWPEARCRWDVGLGRVAMYSWVHRPSYRIEQKKM